jgi:hypothetical protein
MVSCKKLAGLILNAGFLKNSLIYSTLQQAKDPGKALRNMCESYGRKEHGGKTFCYIRYRDEKDRVMLQALLNHFKIEHTTRESCKDFEIRVSYFQAWHYDE